MIIQRLSELRGQKPPGRGCSRELGLGTSWSRFGLTHTVWILASLSVPGGFCNISHLCGPSLPQGTCGGLGALCAFHYLAFILRPITICAQGTNLAALPEALLSSLISQQPLGQKWLVLPKASQYSLPAHSFPFFLPNSQFFSFPHSYFRVDLITPCS